ncbi:MAG: hypothetical protein LAQ69_15840 [Acidobacteriia bacterium]|nr:hypothetical protein [Terriglobia bacterium]
MRAKTVRNIAGVVSSAFARAIRWGLVTTNPVTQSEPPVPKKPNGIALTPEPQTPVVESASGPWCIQTFLETATALDARRGEILGLRWTDIKEGRANIERSITQTEDALEFKGTRNDRPRTIKIPASAQASPEAHRKRQDEFRQQFGPDYQAGDLIFANPDGSPLRPDSVSAAVSVVVLPL